MNLQCLSCCCISIFASTPKMDLHHNKLACWSKGGGARDHNEHHTSSVGSLIFMIKSYIFKLTQRLISVYKTQWIITGRIGCNISVIFIFRAILFMWVFQKVRFVTLLFFSPDIDIGSLLLDITSKQKRLNQLFTLIFYIFFLCK